MANSERITVMTVKISKALGNTLRTATCMAILFGATYVRSEVKPGTGDRTTGISSIKGQTLLLAEDGQESHGGKGGGKSHG